MQKSREIHGAMARDTVAIERFKSSFTLHIAFCVVNIVVQLGLLSTYPNASGPLLCALADNVVRTALRWYARDLHDQQSVRWLLGWAWVVSAAALYVMCTLSCPSNLKIDHISTGVVASSFFTTIIFQNIFSVPSPCRMLAMLIYASMCHALPVEWAIGNGSCLIMSAMVIGEIVGQGFVNHDNKASAVGEDFLIQRLQSSFVLIFGFSILSIILELYLSDSRPAFAFLFVVSVTTHIAILGAVRYLDDPYYARWLFGWGWAIMSTGRIVAFCFAQQQSGLHVRDKLDATVISMVVVPNLLTFAIQQIVGTPWLVRWTMAFTVSILFIPIPSSVNIVCACVMGMLVGEIAGFLWLKVFEETFSSLFGVCFNLVAWSLAFEDKTKEAAYVANNFKKSFVITIVCCCSVIASLLAIAGFHFPTLHQRFLFSLPFWVSVLIARIHVEYTATPLGSKSAHFGFTVVILSVLSFAFEVIGMWIWATSQETPPIVAAAFACCIALFVMIGKLACLPEQYRHAIHVILLSGRIAVSWSDANRPSKIFLYCATLLTSELLAYAFEHQRRLTARLLEKEEQVKLSLCSNPSPSCITDRRMTIKHINSGMTSMFGYTKQELVGKHLGILMTSSLAKCHDKVAQKFLASNGKEVKALHKDGCNVDVRLNIDMTADRAFVSFVDLAPEKERQQLERNMLFALETTVSPIAITDSRMKLTYVNQATCAMFGYTSKELVGRDIAILVNEETRKKHQALVDSFGKTANGGPIRIVAHEFETNHKNGHTLYLRLSLNIADDGKVLVASFQDLSAEVRQQRESERKLKHYTTVNELFSTVPGTLMLEVCNPGPNQSIQFVAGAEPDFLGYTAEEIKSERFLDKFFADPVCRPLVQETLKEITMGKPVQLRDLEAKHRDGHKMWINIGKVSRRLANGNHLVVVHDVTADVFLRETRATFQNLPGYILVTTDTVSHLGVDGDVFGVTGYTDDEFLSLDPRLDFLSPKADHARVMASFASVTHSTKSFNEIVIQHVHKDGHSIWLRLCHGSRQIGTMSTGEPKILLVFSDVTETVVAQREAVAARDALARRLKFMPAMVYEMVSHGANDQWSFKSVSTECVSIYGLTEDEMTSSLAWMDMLHPEDVELYENSLSKSMTSLQSWELEFRIIAGGKTKYLHGRAEPRREGDTVVWTGVIQDVTVNHNLHEMTKKRNIQKAIAERFKSACDYLSHEIRNQLYPQSVILAEMKAGESKWTENIEMILGANTTVNTILNCALDLAKWESGEFPVHISYFPIKRLFKAVAMYAQSRGAIIEGLASVESVWCVKADEHLLKQAATNLISNALKFGQNRPVKISMLFEQESDTEAVVKIVVIDKGRGIAPDQLHKVMVPFAQIRQAGELHSGTGLGLPLTKAMIEIGHKGTLTLASEGLGKGTIATMRVPLLWVTQYDPPPQKSDALWWVTPHPGVTADILVVDDIKLNRMVTIFSAKKLKLTFQEACDGEEALKLLVTNTYSIVFMDRQMPKMNGDDATEQARANGYTLPIVMTSGDTFTQLEESVLKERGVTAFLSKLSVPGTHEALQRLHEIKQK